MKVWKNIQIGIKWKRKKKRIIMAFAGVCISGFSVGLFRLSLFGTDPFQCFANGIANAVTNVFPIGVSLTNPLWKSARLYIDWWRTIFCIYMLLLNTHLTFKKYQIVSLTGQILTERPFISGIDISMLHSGIFLLKLIDEGGNSRQLKFIKKWWLRDDIHDKWSIVPCHFIFQLQESFFNALQFLS